MSHYKRELTDGRVAYYRLVRKDSNNQMFFISFAFDKLGVLNGWTNSLPMDKDTFFSQVGSSLKSIDTQEYLDAFAKARKTLHS